MSEIAFSQGFLFLIYGTAGCVFGLLFHLLSLVQRLFRRMRWLTPLGDVLFWFVFTIVFYIMNFNLTNGEIRGFTLLSMALGAALVIFPGTVLAAKLHRRKNSGKSAKSSARRNAIE